MQLSDAKRIQLRLSDLLSLPSYLVSSDSYNVAGRYYGLWIIRRPLVCLAYYVDCFGLLYFFAALGRFLCGVVGHALMMMMILKFLLIFEHLFVANRTSIDIQK